MAKPMLV